MVLQIEVAQARLLLTLVAQCCKLLHLSFLYAVAVLDLFYRKQSNSPIQQASKGCLDCFVQVEAQFGLLRALQGRRIEFRMQYEDIAIVSCVLKAISVFWLVSLTTKKRIPNAATHRGAGNRAQ